MSFWCNSSKKMNENNSTWGTIVVRSNFCSFFWKNWRYQKDTSKLLSDFTSTSYSRTNHFLPSKILPNFPFSKVFFIAQLCFKNGLLNYLCFFSDMKLPKLNSFNNKNRIFSTCIAVKSLGSLIGGQLISEKVGLTTPQLFRYTAIGTFIFIYYVIKF